MVENIIMSFIGLTLLFSMFFDYKQITSSAANNCLQYRLPSSIAFAAVLIFYSVTYLVIQKDINDNYLNIALSPKVIINNTVSNSTNKLSKPNPGKNTPANNKTNPTNNNEIKIDIYPHNSVNSYIYEDKPLKDTFFINSRVMLVSLIIGVCFFSMQLIKKFKIIPYYGIASVMALAFAIGDFTIMEYFSNEPSDFSVFLVAKIFYMLVHGIFIWLLPTAIYLYFAIHHYVCITASISIASATTQP